MPFGAETTGLATAFRLWAPGAQAVDLVLGVEAHARAVALSRSSDAWFEARVDGIGAGARYAYRIDGGLVVPDPASRANPDGVHGRSLVVDPGAYA